MKKLRSSLIEKTVEPAIDFIENVVGRKAVVLHDEDCDGVCSGAIMGKLLAKKKFKVKFLAMHPDSKKLEGVWKKVKRLGADVIVILDLPSIPEERIRELKSRILIVDHHMPREYSNCLYINPRIFEREAYIPTSCLCYKIYRNFFDEREVCWIAGVGVLGDFGVKSCRCLFEKIKSYYPELCGVIEERGLFKDSLLGVLVRIIDSSRVVKGEKGAVLASSFLAEISDWREIFRVKRKESKKLVKWYLLSRLEIERLKKDFERKRIIRGNKILFIFSSPFKLKSTFATYLSQKYRKKVIIVAQEEGRWLNASIRRGECNKTDLNLLVGKLKAKVPGLEGGGHPQAAAFKVPLKYKELVIRYLGF